MPEKRKMRLVDLAVGGVTVPERLRAVDPSKVDALAASMDAIGLQHPISVQDIDDGPEVVLVAGHHRLLAAKKLGWRTILAAMVDDMDDLDRRLWEIDENLQRANLSPAEEADHLKRRAELWEARNKGGTTRPTPGGEQTVGFASETAKATGKSKRDINRAIRRAEKIAPDVLKVIKGGALDTGVELDELAGMSHDEQRQTLTLIQGGKAKTVHKPRRRGRSVTDGLRNSIGVLVGIASAWDGLSIGDAELLDPEEARVWGKELSAVASSINRIRRQLKEYTRED